MICITSRIVALFLMASVVACTKIVEVPDRQPLTPDVPTDGQFDSTTITIDDRIDSTATPMEAIPDGQHFAFDSASGDLVYFDQRIGTLVRRNAMTRSFRSMVGGLRDARGVWVAAVELDGSVVFAPYFGRSLNADLVRAPASNSSAREVVGRVGQLGAQSPNRRFIASDTVYLDARTSRYQRVAVRYDLLMQTSKAVLLGDLAPQRVAISNSATELAYDLREGSAMLSMTDSAGVLRQAEELPSCRGAAFGCGAYVKEWRGDTAVVDHIDCSNGSVGGTVTHRRRRVPGAAGWEVIGSAELPRCPVLLFAASGRTLLVWSDPLAPVAPGGNVLRRMRLAVGEWSPTRSLTVRGRLQGDRPMFNWDEIPPIQLSPDGRSLAVAGHRDILVGRLP